MKTLYLSLSLLAFSCLVFSGRAAGDVYDVSGISREIRQNARSVVRNEEIVFTVKSAKSGVLKVTCAITVLNKNGLEDAYFLQMYDKFRTVSGISGRIYNEQGKPVKKISSGDIQDYSAISGYSLYDDSRVKFIDPEHRIIPFTVEYSYEVTFNGLFQYPAWYPQSDYNISVEKSSFKVVVPADLELRYRELNLPSTVEITSDLKNRIYYWRISDIHAREKEPFSVPSHEIFPGVLIAPSDFELNGRKGNMDSWANLGKWVSELNEGRNVLPPEAISHIQGLVTDADSDYEKICRIYEYMQGRVRYVSVSIGIGGWQPVDAATVHRLSYGECKALTNYMKTMLEVAGIPSYYCLVLAGSIPKSIVSDFPSQQFNHVFLCVPLGGDTLWLECTSQRLPCGFIGDFTDDRKVLLVDNENSQLVHSRVYGAEENHQGSLSNIVLDETGKGSYHGKTRYTGLKYDDILSVYLSDDTDRKRAVSERIRFPSFQISGIDYKECREIIPFIDETISLTFENYLAVTDSKLILALNCTNRIRSVPPNVRSRKTEVCVYRSYIEQDTIVYDIPASLMIESVPASVSINNIFGEYKAHVERNENRLVYYRTLAINKGRYPPETYADFRSFFEKMSIADNMKCVLSLQ
ncbi:MAG: DUF3857 domain-containing protein [Bacteroidales bacterium]|nr:DUF3857 domain-containing protein [Bacteroidales bacterium]